ncbi:hypothetical protein VTO73DRAFT_4826 [Trametes versicolor]
MNGGIRNHPLDGPSSYVAESEDSSLALESSYSEDDDSSETPLTDDDDLRFPSIGDSDEEYPVPRAIRALLEGFTPREMQRIQADEAWVLPAIQTPEIDGEGYTRNWKLILGVVAITCATGYLIVAGPNAATLDVSGTCGGWHIVVSGSYKISLTSSPKRLQEVTGLGASPLKVATAAAPYFTSERTYDGALHPSLASIHAALPVPEQITGAGTGIYEASYLVIAGVYHTVLDSVVAGTYGVSRLHRYRGVMRIYVALSGTLIMAVTGTCQVLHLVGERTYCDVESVVAPVPGIFVGAVAAAVNGISQLGQRAGKLFADLNPMRLMRYRLRA